MKTKDMTTLHLKKSIGPGTAGRAVFLILLASFALSPVAEAFPTSPAKPTPTPVVFSFVSGNIYSTNYGSFDIIEYSSKGGALASLTLSSTLGDGLRGIVFGPDGLLYAVMVRGSGFAVLALDSSGVVHKTYSMDPLYLAGNISYGKIAVDSTYIYVAGASELIRFTLGSGDPGTSIYSNNQVFDVKVLPSGHLLVASAYAVDEITNAGAFVRSIPLSGASFVDVRGIEYDPAKNKLFATELGYTNFFFQLMRINASTGVLEKSATFNYADDLFLTQSGTLLVGSRTETPRIYTENLNSVGTVGITQRMFVTQYIAR
jgi:hypothetical protein